MSRTQKIILIIFSFSFIVYCASRYLGQDAISLPHEPAANSFVVLELFTSQGCSSCPSADEQIRKITNMARDKNLPIFTMSFHVDYWDHLGWKDCYSDQKFTARQYQYGRVFAKRNIYTPQMVVNGVHEFVGSDGAECERLIAASLKEKQVRGIEFSVNYSISEYELNISYDVEENFNGYVNIALVQNESEISIKNGENSGRNITYSNIVRSFQQIDCREKSNGEIQIDIPKDLTADNFSITVYLQNKIDMKIIGAKKAALI